MLFRCLIRRSFKNICCCCLFLFCFNVVEVVIVGVMCTCLYISVLSVGEKFQLVLSMLKVKLSNLISSSSKQIKR